MKIIAADSSTAVLDRKFEPSMIVASAAVLVSPPYREPSESLAKPLFAPTERGHEVVVQEAKLCKALLEKRKADVIHLDMSLGGVPVEQLSPIQFSNIRVSSRARRHLIRILPKLRKIAGEITQRHGIEVLALGKESIPVRIAELTAGAYAVLYACEKALQSNQPILLGLPSRCQPRSAEKRMELHSLMAAEHDVRGYANDAEEILKRVNIAEMLNPRVRGFRALKIYPKGGS